MAAENGDLPEAEVVQNRQFIATNLERAMYFAYGRLSNRWFSEANGPTLTKISELVDGSKGLFTSLSFIRILMQRCHGNQLKFKNQRFCGPISLSQCHFKTNCNITILISNDRMNFSALCTILITFGPVTRVYTVYNNTFCSDTAKIGISRQISQNILHLSWPTLQVW